MLSEIETIKTSIEKFSRLQDYMIQVEKDSNVYKSMKKRYVELKIFLQIPSVNLTELDIIKE